MTQPSSSLFFSLPDECISEVFSFLSIQELFFRCRSTCRNFHELIVGFTSPFDDKEKKNCMIRNQKLKASFLYNNPIRLKSLWTCIRKGYFEESVTKLSIAADAINLRDSLLDKNDFFVKYFSNLEHLTLKSKSMSCIHISELFTPENSKYLRKLTKLNLKNNNLEKETVIRIANCENLINLKSLNLNSNYIETEGLELVTSPYLINLTNLNLGGDYIQKSGNWIDHDFKLKNLENITISDSLEVVFNNSKHLFDKLTYLDASDTLAREEVFLAMSKNDFTPSLLELHLNYVELKESTVSLIAKSKCLSKLEHLELTSCSLTGTAFAHLTKSNYLSNLKTLSAESNDIDFEGFIHFGTDSYTLKNLTVLDLISNDFSLQSYEYLLREPSLKKLKRLFCDNLDEIEAKYISEHQENISEVTHLVFTGYSEMEDDSLKYLAMLKMPNLKKLKSTGTGGTCSGLISFLENSLFENLEKLEIGKVAFANGAEKTKAISALLSNKHFSKLRNLTLDELSQESMNMILDNMDNNKLLSKLTVLSVSRISSGGFKALTKHPNSTKFRMLAFMEGQLTDESIECFVKSPYFHNLEYLDLIGVDLSRESSQLIAKSTNIPNMVFLMGGFNLNHFVEETSLPKLCVYSTGCSEDETYDDEEEIYDDESF